MWRSHCPRSRASGGREGWLGRVPSIMVGIQLTPSAPAPPLTPSLLSLQREVRSRLYLYRESHWPQAGSQGHQETDAQRQGSRGGAWLWERGDLWSVGALSPSSPHVSVQTDRRTALPLGPDAPQRKPDTSVSELIPGLPLLGTGHSRPLFCSVQPMPKSAGSGPGPAGPWASGSEVAEVPALRQHRSGLV